LADPISEARNKNWRERLDFSIRSMSVTCMYDIVP
jgi:hypothetical protein